MDTRQLRSFVALAERLHFREAAESLSMAQPTLTYQIQSLENSLGVTLFERGNRRIRLTDAGAVLHVEAKRVLAQLEVAQARVVEAAQGDRGTLVIGAITPVTLTVLPHVLTQFRLLYPDVAVRVRILTIAGVMAALRSREIQVGFSAANETSAGISSQPLWEHSLRVLLPATHAAGQSPEVTLSDLRGTPLVALSRKNVGDSFDLVLSLCRENGLYPETIEEVETVDSLVGLVSCGHGFAILPESVEPFRAPSTVFRPFANSSKWRLKTSAFWGSDEATPLVRRLVDIAASVHVPSGE
jgi:DNA-binding transcriptional LysR family regulator